MPEKLTVSVSEAVTLTGIGRPTIYAWLASGLPHVKSLRGGKFYIPVDELMKRVKEEARISTS